MEQDEIYLWDRMMAGDLPALQEAAAVVEGFPQGVDVWGKSWIGQAVRSASAQVIKWMLGRGVDLAKREGEIDPLLHCAIDRSTGDRHDILAN